MAEWLILLPFLIPALVVGIADLFDRPDLEHRHPHYRPDQDGRFNYPEEP